MRQGFSDLTLPRDYLLGFLLSDYWGRATQTEIGAFAQARALYVGALPLVLAAVALLSRRSCSGWGSPCSAYSCSRSSSASRRCRSSPG